MSQIPVDDLQYTGHTTLEHLAEARALNQWMFQALEPYLTGTVLEVGSGTGTFSEFALTSHPCYLSDYEQSYCEELGRRYKDNANFKGAVRIDLNAAPAAVSPTVRALEGTIDTIFAINVLEHIGDHEAALKLMRFMLKPGGHLALFVPAGSWLFNDLDRAFGHKRRYTKRSLQRLMVDNGLTVTHVRYFNPLGIPGWLTLGGLLKKKKLPRSSVALYDRILPVAQFADRIASGRVGLSLILCAQKE